MLRVSVELKGCILRVGWERLELDLHLNEFFVLVFVNEVKFGTSEALPVWVFFIFITLETIQSRRVFTGDLFSS